jgi:hypothetical protein
MLADNSRGGESGEVLHLTIQNLILKIWGHLEHPFGSELRRRNKITLSNSFYGEMV